MKLPAGTQGGVVLDPKNEDMVEHLRTFRGAIEIDTGRGKGFILMRNGELVAAYFEDKDGVYRGGRCGTMYHGHPGE